MKLALTKDMKSQLRELASTLVFGLITGDFKFSKATSATLRLLADEIDKQNSTASTLLLKK